MAIASAQALERSLERIGLDAEVRGFPPRLYGGRLNAPGEPWDIAFWPWAPDYLDPYAYLNVLLDGRFVGKDNVAHFDLAKYNRQLRSRARRSGKARYRGYASLDVRLARDAAPLIAISYLHEPTFVSTRVDPHCLVLRPAQGWALALAAVCLKPPKSRNRRRGCLLRVYPASVRTCDVLPGHAWRVLATIRLAAEGHAWRGAAAEPGKEMR